MKKEWFAALLILALASVAQAQTPTTKTSKLVFDNPNPGGFNYEYAVYIDAGPRQVLQGVTCDGSTCSAPVPAMTPGDHTLQLTIADTKSIPGTTMESDKSDPLTIRVYIAPVAPSGLRIGQ